MTRQSLPAREMLARLIAFDTTSRLSNMALIEFVRDYLAGLSIDSRLIHDDSGAKANLLATIGPSDRPGIVLSGHTDVVPVDGQKWNSNPFELTERDGVLHGRGTCDMKGFIACVLALVPEIKAARLPMPVHLAFSYDEEVGCLGAPRLVEQLCALPVPPRGCIVGEPTEMKPVTAHKGKTAMRCCVHGHESHSALTHIGANAVEAAAEIVAFLKGLARRYRDQGRRDDGFTPPYTTIHTGTIAGGTALNIVPRECAFDFEIRHLPGDDPQAILAEVRSFVAERIEPELKAVAATTGVDWRPISSYPALDTDPNAALVTLARQLTGANALGKVSFGTEGGLYHQGGIPTIVCGPGSIEQAHKPDEFVALSQLAACESFLRRLLERLQRGDAHLF